MNHRIISFPILPTTIFVVVLSLPCLSQAEPGVPADNTATNSTPAPTAPATTTAPPPVATPSGTAAETPAVSTSTYTVVTGDSLWTIAHKYNCTVKQLQKVNNLKPHALLHPGQVLKLPATASPSPTPSTPPVAPATKPDASIPQPITPKHHKLYAQAQPVQDFDIPASTFASCPVPIPSETDDETKTPASSAPVAQLVAPEELNAEPTVPAPSTSEASETTAGISPHPSTNFAPLPPSPPLPSPDVTAKAEGDDSSTRANSEPETAYVPPSSKQPNRSSNSGPNPLFTTPSSDWANRFLQEARALSEFGIDYDEDWRPPGETHAWTMDCSNTARYLYKITTGIQLPRTASDQYYYLHLQNKAWDVPQGANGFADRDYLQQNLKPGDLLFWENTYRPERQPPITHVMVFLGTNDKGQWIMAGSQTNRGGLHNRHNGGVDIYAFDPAQPSGGYSTWLGMVHHHGRFCAFGRPLEADKTKLAVASND